jgi:hypothetical protein
LTSITRRDRAVSSALKSRPDRIGIFNVSKYPGETYENRDALRSFPAAPLTRKKWDQTPPLSGTWLEDAAATTPGTERISLVSCS